MQTNLYSQKFQRKIKVIGIISLFIFIMYAIIETFHFINTYSSNFNLIYIEGIIVNLACAVLCILTVFRPTHFGYFSIITIIYGIWILYKTPDNFIPFLLFYFSLVVLNTRGFFRKFKKAKIIFTILFFTITLLYPLKLGFLNFLNLFVQNFSCLFVMVAIRIFLTSSNYIKDSKKILKLSEYEGLRERDCDWLKRIQSGEKYQKIAIEYNLSQGTIKNRLKEIYEILEVGDKTGFLTRYSESEILY